MGSGLLPAKGLTAGLFGLHTVKNGGLLLISSWSWLSHLQGGHSLGALCVEAKKDESVRGC